MNEQNIFITGITGKIGRALIPRLDFSHYDIYALCRNTDYHFNQPLKIIKGNLSEPESYSAVFQHNIHTVVHLGAVTHTNDPAEYYRINEEATRKLIRLCEDHKINRFVLISTRSISDNGGDYSRSKLLAETHTINSSIDWVIIRLSEIYGISENEGVDFILNRIKKMPFVPVIGNGEYSIAPLHISDAVSAINTIIEKDEIRNKIYTLAGPENFTYNDFIEKIKALYGIKKIKIHIPVSIASILLKIYVRTHKRNALWVTDQLPRLLSDKSYDISDAAKDLHFNPLSIEEFIRGACSPNSAS